MITCKIADVAQSVEHILGKDEVTSSNLVISSKKFDKFRLVDFFYPLRKQWYIITTQSWISSAVGCISSAVGCIFCRNDDIQGFRLGDIQNFVLMICTPLAWLRRYSSSPNKKWREYLFYRHYTKTKALPSRGCFCFCLSGEDGLTWRSQEGRIPQAGGNERGTRLSRYLAWHGAIPPLCISRLNYRMVIPCSNTSPS